jgi:hypothetical protein
MRNPPHAIAIEELLTTAIGIVPTLVAKAIEEVAWGSA